MTRIAVAIVLLNAVVLVAHNVAHEDLGILLNAWQTTFVYTVIVPAPFAALVLITRLPRVGYWVLLVSMVGSLLFGVYHHFVAVSPDHVAHLPPGESRGLFRITAALMAFIQLQGAAIAIWALRSLDSLGAEE